MKNRSRLIALALTAVLALSLILLTGCGGSDDLENYMKGQPAMRGQIDAQLNILSPDAKAAVLYKGDTAEVTVTYYALTQAEIAGEETEKATTRCNIILQDAVDQFHEDTGKTAEVKVIVYGHDVEKK